MSPIVFDSFVLINSGFEPDGATEYKIAACENFIDYAALSARCGNVYAPFCNDAIKAGIKKIYVPTLDLPDKTLDKLIEYSFESDAELAVSCASDLEETGIIDSRFGKSPVMLLHEFGLLDKSVIISGVYLDKDDLSLMAQQNVPLVVLPSSDAGAGHGVAPVCAALDKGVIVRLGSGDGTYNVTHSVLYEAAVLRLLVSAQMNRADAVNPETLALMCVSENTSKEDIKIISDKIQKI